SSLHAGQGCFFHVRRAGAERPGICTPRRRSTASQFGLDFAPADTLNWEYALAGSDDRDGPDVCAACPGRQRQAGLAVTPPTSCSADVRRPVSALEPTGPGRRTGGRCTTDYVQ